MVGVLVMLSGTPALAAAPVAFPVPDVSPGRAPTPTIRELQEALELRPGATCLSAETLVEHVRSWLGKDEVAVGVRIEVEGDEHASDAAVIIVHTPAGVIERPFEHGPPGCSDLHAVIGLAIAMAIDASVLASLGYDVIESPPASPGVDPELPPLQARRKVAPASPPPPPRKARVRAAAALRGGLWLGALPGIAGGGQLQMELGWRPWFELRAGVLGGRGRPQPLGSGTVELGLVAGRIDACFGVSRRRLRPRLCVGPTAGVYQALGRGLTEAVTVVRPWAAAALAVELRIAATKVFAVDVTLDALIPFIKPVVQVRDKDKPGMIGDAVTFAPIGVVIGIGGAFTIR
ncbi:MAG: hypothetical protein H0T76_27705 [Nannocystis sp.]|nr:hypothetical protein [Nannocystis sp.]MBA3550279.1 hypothetical protein [Nannocystis sp.]